MCRNYRRRIFSLLLGMLIFTAGCDTSEGTEGSTTETAETELPPLVTAETVVETEETEEVTEVTTTTEAEALYVAQVETWELPEEFGYLQEVRVCGDAVYLLSLEQTLSSETKGILFRVEEEPEPTFTQLFTNAAESDFIGLTDFDVLSDGTICGLVCESTNSVPYEDPTYDAETFDWDTYYETNTTQYRLVWYNENGSVTQKLGLSTLLNLDDTEMQTVAFTSIRCDSTDQIYLTAVIDDQEYLMALDENQNLCTVQGSGAEMLTLESGYQWIRCGSDGMLLWEQNNSDDTMDLYHIVVTDDSLWKTSVEISDTLTETTILAEEHLEGSWYGAWDEVGIYRVLEKNGDPELLYSWKDLKLDADEVADVILLSETKVLLTSYTAQGDLTIQLLVPEDYETTTEPEATTNALTTQAPIQETTTETTVPVATPVTSLDETDDTASDATTEEILD